MDIKNLELFLSSSIPTNSTRKVSFRLSKDDYENLRFLASRSKVPVHRLFSNKFDCGNGWYAITERLCELERRGY